MKTNSRSSKKPSGTERASQYVDDVLSGKIDVCLQVKQACKRHIEDLEDGEYVYDEGAANRVVQFCELLKHVKGEWAGRLLTLEPWQCFVVCSVFGWLAESGLRRYRTSYIEVPRKNAKSTLSAAIALYLLTADKEPGAEVYSAATNVEQARIVFDTARQMVRRSRSLMQAFDLRVLGGAATAGKIIGADDSIFRPLARDMRGNLDGLNIHGCIIDELHAHKTRDIWEVLATATGARQQPLLWAITTAGSNRAGICYEQRGYVERILKQEVTDDTYFGIVYTTDRRDDWRKEPTWKKANPNYGISVKPDDIERKAKQAQQVASAQNGFLTKHLDVWVNAAVSWLNMSKFEQTKESIDWDTFEGESVWIGMDLAKRIDLTAVAYVWQKGGKLYSKVRYYLPRETVEVSENAQYSGWARDGLLTVTPGAKTDFREIERQIVKDSEKYYIEGIAYDAYQAQNLANILDQDHGLPLTEFAQTYGTMSAPMKELEGMILEGEFVHDGNPVTEWCFSNTLAVSDMSDNIKPTRNRDDPLAKIDGAVATIMAVELAIASGEASDFYNLNEAA